MNKEREIAGIKVFVSNETYNEYKGTLQDQINELQDRINKQKEVLDKIKEYVKNNEKCVVVHTSRDFMNGIPYTTVEKGLIEKSRIEKLLEEIK